MQLIVMYFYWNKSCSLLKKQKKKKKKKKNAMMYMLGKINDKKAVQLILHCISFFKNISCCKQRSY